MLVFWRANQPIYGEIYRGNVMGILQLTNTNNIPKGLSEKGGFTANLWPIVRWK